MSRYGSLRLIGTQSIHTVLTCASALCATVVHITSTVNSVGSVCSYGSVRLVEGDSAYEGAVEVCISNQWGAICDNQWDSVDATVICKQLGYSYTGGK